MARAGTACVSSELVRRVVLFGALIGWCAALLVLRFLYSGSPAFAFLAWNLFLAAVPAVAAWRFTRAAGKRSAAVIQLSWFAIWLAFLPNAPYVVTDFRHLAPVPEFPLWYDVALLASCAGTGLLLGYASLADVHAVIARKFSAMMGWALAAGALFLSGFGIYLGQMLRWNTWDALTNPGALFSDTVRRLSDPLSRTEALGITLTYGMMLLLGYIALRVLWPGSDWAGCALDGDAPGVDARTAD